MPDLWTEKYKFQHRLTGLVQGIGEEIAGALENALSKVTGKIVLLESKAEQTKSLVRKKKYLDQQIIEILPLAFMRGRTLNNAFVILDEAQNSTFTQMKMFLTRLGKNSKAVITGDITQIDLPSKKHSGLITSLNVLDGIRGITFVNLGKEDVVRHALVKEIIDAYERFDMDGPQSVTPQEPG